MRKHYLLNVWAVVGLCISIPTHNLSGISKENQKNTPRPWEKFLKKGNLHIDYPNMEHRRMSNGIQLYYLQGKTIPKTYLKIIVEGGLVEEPSHQIGLTSLWGSSIVYSGSEEYPQEKLSIHLEDHASSFSFGHNSEFASFHFTALSNFFEKDLEMILQVLNEPRFHPDDIQLIKKQKIQSKKKRKENPASLARMGAHKVYWGDHPRGRVYTEQTISQLERADMKNWHKKMWAPSRLKVLLAGDFNIESTVAILEKYSPPPLAFNPSSYMKIKPDMLANKKETTYHIHKEIPQSTMIWRSQGIAHHSREYFALKVFDLILGGDSFNSFLTQDIRARRGWAYSVYSSYRSDKYGGYISIVAQSQNHNVPALFQRLGEILGKPEEFVDAERVERAKTSIRNKFVFLYKTHFQLLNNLIILKRHGLSDDYLSTFLDNIDRVSLEEVFRIAKKYYHPSQFVKVIVGPTKMKLSGKVTPLVIPD